MVSVPPFFGGIRRVSGWGAALKMLQYLTVAALAGVVGAPEPALRLLLSMLAAYPFAWIVQFFPVLKKRSLLLPYLVAAGILLGVFNFGTDIWHSLVAVLFTYLSIKILGAGKICALSNLVFHMGHLLIGYWATGTDTYDIKWTMPHCVLVLRLIGLGFDLWDGTKPPEKLSASNKLTALREAPSLLEIAAHVYFPASFLVGPQFSMVRLRAYVDGKFDDVPEPRCIIAGLERGAIGFCYLAFYQMGTLYIPDDYFQSEAFLLSSFIHKHIILGIWVKITLAKYISCWLLTEGACITFGIAHNGIDKADGRSKWDGCANVRLQIYELCTKFGGYIDSFNINTNNWVAQYVYKRVAFLGSKQMSQAITLAFLALWHGFHSGYYMTFFMEFATMVLEKDFINIVERSRVLEGLSKNIAFNAITFVILKLYVTIFMGYSLIPFTLLSFSKWWAVYKSLYFSGFILYFPWLFVYKPILKIVLKPKKIEDKAQ